MPTPNYTHKLIDQGALIKGDRIAGMIRFIVTGGAATLTYLIAFIAFKNWLAFDAKTLSILAYGCGFCVSYVGQSFFTFKQKGWDRNVFRKFLILSLLGAMLSWVIIAICSDVFKFADIWGAVITAGLIPIISFIVMNFWVFINQRN